MPSYNERLTANNLKIDEITALANTLPDADEINEKIDAQDTIIENLKSALDDKAGKTGGTPNIFLQDEEPTTKQGIWLKKSNAEYEKVVAEDSVIDENGWTPERASRTYNVPDFSELVGANESYILYTRNNVKMLAICRPNIQGGDNYPLFNQSYIWYGAYQGKIYELSNNSWSFLVESNSSAIGSINDIYIANCNIYNYSPNTVIYSPPEVTKEFDDKSIVLLNGITYETQLFTSELVDSSVKYPFADAWYYTEQGGLDTTIPTYYGNGTQWVNIKDPSQTLWAGITVDFVHNTISRISGSSNIDTLKCYKNRKRCNLANDGTVLAYYGDNNYDNVGSDNCQVMVEQPAVYYSLQNVVVDNGAIAKADYLIADGPMEGYELHPAFIRNNVEYDKCYANAFEATLSSSNKLQSVGGGGLTPLRNKTRAEFRTYATARGSIWSQLTKQYEDLESLLMTIEYASFNHQAVISLGVTNSSIQAVGQTYTLDANGTGRKGANISTSDCFTWRWRENKYGNVSKFNDGININGQTWYIKDYNFVDDTSTNYTQLSTTAASSGGYITRFAYVENAKWIFMPKTVSSSQSGLIYDQYYQKSGWQELRSGGAYTFEGIGGSFEILANTSLYFANSDIGGGLLALV